VTYKDFTTVVSVSKGNNVFDELYSKWYIQGHVKGICMVNYEVRMTFSNPLYSKVTKMFFDSLVVNINDAFVKSCNYTYENKLEDAVRDSAMRERPLRDFIDENKIDEATQYMQSKRQPFMEDAFEQYKKSDNSDFSWKVDPRQK
jgi:hypothetical protein